MHTNRGMWPQPWYDGLVQQVQLNVRQAVGELDVDEQQEPQPREDPAAQFGTCAWGEGAQQKLE